MADIPISELGEIFNATSNDFLIINENNSSTKRISASSFLTGSIGGDAFYTPQYIPIRGTAETKTYGQWEDRGNLLNVHTSQTEPVTLPAGANAALIFYFFFDAWHFNPATPDNTTTFGFRQYTSHDLTVTGSGNPNFVSGDAGKNTMGCIVTHNVALSASAATKSPSNRRSNIPQVKFDSIKFTPTANQTTTLNFTVNTDILRGGWNVWSTNFGRLIVIPYNDADGSFVVPSNYDESTLYFRDDNPTSGVASTDKNDVLEQLFPTLSAKELAQEQSTSYLQALHTQLRDLSTFVQLIDAGAADPGNKKAEAETLMLAIQGYINSNTQGVGNLTSVEVLADIGDGVGAPNGYPGNKFQAQTNAILDGEFDFARNA